MKKILLTASVLLFLVSCDNNQKVYEWRTNDRSGIFNETNLLKEWPAEGPEEIWSIDGLGAGYGSPTFTKDKFYITGEKDTEDEGVAEQENPHHQLAPGHVERLLVRPPV